MTTRRAFWILGVVLVTAAILRIVDVVRPDAPEPSSVPAVTLEELRDKNPEPQPAPAPSPATPTPTPEPVPELPAELNLAVPFAPQAPFHVWDALHEDTCEEASVLMAIAFANGQTSFDMGKLDVELNRLVAWQTERGYGSSVTAAELVEITKGALNAQLKIVENPSTDDLKALLRSGKVVIVPAAGRELKNPYFTGEGPLYHMLVLRGYTAHTFITNDPGTQHGENYSYPQERLMEALGDWAGGHPENGPKRVLIVDN